MLKVLRSVNKLQSYLKDDLVHSCSQINDWLIEQDNLFEIMPELYMDFKEDVVEISYHVFSSTTGTGSSKRARSL